MESQPQNPEFRINPEFRVNPENFHPFIHITTLFYTNVCCMVKTTHLNKYCKITLQYLK